MSTWLYLEPYVFVSIKGKDILFYNTLDGRALEFWNRPEIARLAKRLLHYHNLYVVEMSPADLQNTEWSQCLSQLREHFMGDLYEGLKNFKEAGAAAATLPHHAGYLYSKKRLGAIGGGKCP